MRIIAGWLLLFTTTFLACSTSENEPPPAPPQLELRNAQTRTYATNDVKTVMKATVNVLQDLGFVLKSADSALGVITAEKWSDIPHTSKELRRAEKDGKVLPQNLVLECTLNISPFGDQVRVRASFQRKTYAAGGTVLEARPVADLRFYQEFFSKVDKSVFLELEGV